MYIAAHFAAHKIAICGINNQLLIIEKKFNNRKMVEEEKYYLYRETLSMFLISIKNKFNITNFFL